MVSSLYHKWPLQRWAFSSCATCHKVSINLPVTGQLNIEESTNYNGQKNKVQLLMLVINTPKKSPPNQQHEAMYYRDHKITLRTGRGYKVALCCVLFPSVWLSFASHTSLNTKLNLKCSSTFHDISSVSSTKIPYSRIFAIMKKNIYYTHKGLYKGRPFSCWIWEKWEEWEHLIFFINLSLLQ